MKNQPPKWSKTELKIYILLLCANADSVMTADEIRLIKAKTAPEVYERIYNEFSEDEEDSSLEKIEASVAKHHFSIMELSELKKEMYSVFISDNNFEFKERYLCKILDNIIY